MKRGRLNALAATLACVGMLLSPLTSAAEVPAAPRDVALHEDGVLVGQIVDTQGRGLAKAPVVLISTGKEVAQVTTDDAGRFQIKELTGGVYEVAAPGQRRICRLWAPATAPPAAQSGLMMVSGAVVVRAQCCGGGVGCGSAVCGCRGGGLIGWLADHPVITAGAIAAAIAIPLATDDDDDPASP